MTARETFVEDIADHGNRSLDAEVPFHFVHADEPPEPRDSSATQKFQKFKVASASPFAAF